MISVYVFQSTHPRGVRLWCSPLKTTPSCFNPRTHEGCDSGRAAEPSISSVSIHAPTRGATDDALSDYHDNMFQSTHPRGVRRLAYSNLFRIVEFQSTHPRGVRLRLLIIITIYSMFQSTHPRGVRLTQRSWVSERLKFQSTHPRGVRQNLTYI